MATQSYETALQMAESLNAAERRRLVEELTTRAASGAPPEPLHSIMELCGLGKEIWEGIDAQEYVNGERDSWNL
jgi:hypothetical protein